MCSKNRLAAPPSRRNPARSDLLEVLDEATLAALPKIQIHGWRPPMLTTLTERRFSDPAWVFERKLDGVRALSTRHGAGPELWSRNQIRISNGYPELIEALAARGGPRF